MEYKPSSKTVKVGDVIQFTMGDFVRNKMLVTSIENTISVVAIDERSGAFGWWKKGQQWTCSSMDQFDNECRNGGMVFVSMVSRNNYKRDKSRMLHGKS